MDIRGSGANTQIILSSRNAKTAAVFTTADGLAFTPVLITVEEASDGNFGLGIAFGDTNTFWGKATGASLRHVAFDLNTGNGETLHNYTATNFTANFGPLGVDPAHQWLGGVALDQPDNLCLFDLQNPANTPVLLDQQLFPTDNDNLNGTGAVDFGGGRLYALDSNNEILAFAVKKPSLPPPEQPVLKATQGPANGWLRLTLAGEVGRTYVIEASSRFSSWTAVATNIADTTNLLVNVPATEAINFYRALTRP